MHKKYRVTLTLAEREELKRLLARGKADVRKIKHAQILLKADEAESGPAWPDARIGEAFAVGITTVERVRQRFVEEGLASALSPYRGGRRIYERKLDGAQEAHLIVLACSAPPNGRARWTLRLLARRMVELAHVDTLSHETVRQTEWLIEKHGTRRRRAWRKMHIGVEADTGRIVASELTTHDVDDGSQVGPLLDQVTGPIASFTGDGAYDQDGVSRSVAERHPDARVIVPPRSSAVPSETAETAPTQRDQCLQLIAEHGRMGWQTASGYNRRALAEATIGRFKRVIGDGLRSRTDQRQAAEMNVAVAVLNRMLDLGRPKSVRIA